MAVPARVLISGGTGSIGRETVRAFSASGYPVSFLYRCNDRAARQLEEETGAAGIPIDFLSDDWEALLPDENPAVLVNNAGINISRSEATAVSRQDWEQTLRVNLTVPFVMCQRYLPGMIEARYGRIINVSSIYGLCATPGNLPYTASKHGLSGLTKTLAKEYGRFGITVNELCPGAVESDLVRRIAAHFAAEEETSQDQQIAGMIQEIPTARLAVPGDIASAAVFLASKDTSHINGASIVIDGGMIA